MNEGWKNLIGPKLLIVSFFLTDLNLNIATIFSPGESIMEGESASLNCTAVNVPDVLALSVKITWMDDGGNLLLASNGTLFLNLQLESLRRADSGTYTCMIEIESDLPPENGHMETVEVVLTVVGTSNVLSHY